MQNNKAVKLIVIFFVTAFSATVLAMAGAFLYEKITGNGNSNKPAESSAGSQNKSEPSPNYTNDGSSTASIEYSGNATVNTTENIVSFHFKNPSKSKKSISLKIVAIVNGEEIVIGKKDRLAPGDLVKELPYQPEKEIEKGNYDGKYVLHFYNEAGEEEIVNSEVLINIRVN